MALHDFNRHTSSLGEKTGMIALTLAYFFQVMMMAMLALNSNFSCFHTFLFASHGQGVAGCMSCDTSNTFDIKEIGWICIWIVWSQSMYGGDERVDG